MIPKAGIKRRLNNILETAAISAIKDNFANFFSYVRKEPLSGRIDKKKMPNVIQGITWADDSNRMFTNMATTSFENNITSPHIESIPMR